MNGRLTVVHALPGPNVFASVCNYHPDRNTNNAANVCDDGTFDEVADATANGCGIALAADSTGIHPGNFWTNAFVYALFFDAATNEICIGTTGVTYDLPPRPCADRATLITLKAP